MSPLRPLLCAGDIDRYRNQRDSECAFVNLETSGPAIFAVSASEGERRQRRRVGRGYFCGRWRALGEAYAEVAEGYLGGSRTAESGDGHFSNALLMAMHN